MSELTLNDDELREEAKDILTRWHQGEFMQDDAVEKLHSLMQGREAEAKKEERDRIIKWGNEDCPHRMMADIYSDSPDAPDISLRKRWECPTCWQALKEE